MLNKKFCLSLLCLSLLSVFAWGKGWQATALDSLDTCLARKNWYDQVKQARIDSLQALIYPPPIS